MADNAQQARDPDVVAYSSFTGLRNDVLPERFGPTDLATADNVDLDNSGKVDLRAGFTRQSATATHSVWSDEALLAFCVQGSQLMRVNLDFSLTAIYTGLTAGRPMSYSRVNDSVYMSNGREALVYNNGVVRSWGLPVPPTPTAVQVAPGSLGGGSYQFTVTYVRADGQESGAAPVSGRIDVVVPSSGGTFRPQAAAVRLGLAPVTDAAVVSQNIYFSAPNGDVLYLIANVPASTSTFTYNGTLAPGGYELQGRGLSPAPAGQIVGYYSGRLYVMVDDMLYPSEPYAYEQFDLRKYLPLDGRGTLFAVLEEKERLDSPGMDGGLFIGTDKSCGIMVGSSPEEFQYVPRLNYGAIEGALAYVDGTLFSDGAAGARKLPMWLTAQGICAGLPGMEIKNVTRNRFTFSAGGRGCALFDPDPNRFIAVSNF